MSFKGFLILLIICSTFQHGFGKSVTVCEDTDNPGTLAADIITTESKTINLRIPETGLLTKKITCILIIDNKNSNSNPVISSGGIGNNYVEITITPVFLERLDYRVQVYTMAPTTTDSTSTTK